MRTLPLVAGLFAVIVFIWEVPYVGSKTGLWPVLMLLAAGVLLLAISQIQHGGSK